MKKRTLSLIAIMASLCFASPLLAADDWSQQSSQPGMSGESTTSMSQSSASMSAQDLKGKKVVSQQGEEIGKITEVSQAGEAGEIVTISRGGVLGMGAEKVSIPKEALSFDAQSDQVTLTVEKSMLDNAPQQAEMSNEEFNRELQSYYGVSPAWQQPGQESGEQMGTPQSEQMDAPQSEEMESDPQMTE